LERIKREEEGNGEGEGGLVQSGVDTSKLSDSLQRESDWQFLWV
jgi:hypothetical protein